MRFSKTKQLATMGVLAALSIVLVMLIHFPIFPAAPYLEYDPADIPILIGTFLFGTLPGIALTLVVSILQGITVSAGSGWIGILMHFLATGSLVLVVGLMGKMEKVQKNTGFRIFSLVLGVFSMAAVMVVMNLIFTPLFLGGSVQDVLALLLPVIIPFNLIKTGVNVLIAYIIYQPVRRFVK